MMWLAVRGVATRPGRALLTGLVASVAVAIVSGTLMVADAAGPGSDVERIRQVMLIAGAVAALVGAFVAHVTAAVTVGRRTQELGLLRCVGADARQVRRMVLIEASLVGFGASAVGLGSGFGVAALVRSLIRIGVLPGHLFGGSIRPTGTVIAVAVAVGCLPLLLSALGPARQAGRISPVAAADAGRSASQGRLGAPRLIGGTALILVGAVSAPVAVVTDLGLLLIPGAAALLTGVRVAGPGFVGPLAHVVGSPVSAVLGVPGSLGRTNAARNRQRTAATAAALLIGVALVTLVNVLYLSARTPMMAEFARDRADFQLWKEDSRGRAPMPTDLPNRLRAVPGVATVATLWCLPDDQTCAADPSIAAMVGLRASSGDLSSLTAGQVALSDSEAHRLAAAPGSPLKISTMDFTVVATYADAMRFAWPLATSLPGTPSPSTIYVAVAAGADHVAVRAALADTAHAADPAIGVRSWAEILGHDLDMMARAANLYRTLAALAALLGMAGVAGTLVLSIMERRREIGLLRAVGMQCRQVGQMVYAEALSVILTGTVLGAAIGLLFGWAAATVLDSPRQPSEFTLPITATIAVVLAASAAGLLSAVIPARLAARTDVLRAVAD